MPYRPNIRHWLVQVLRSNNLHLHCCAPLHITYLALTRALSRCARPPEAAAKQPRHEVRVSTRLAESHISKTRRWLQLYSNRYLGYCYSRSDSGAVNLKTLNYCSCICLCCSCSLCRWGHKPGCTVLAYITVMVKIEMQWWATRQFIFHESWCLNAVIMKFIWIRTL